MEKENKTLEYKEKLTETYLKTVSAFSNYNQGQIIFGVSDDLKIKPIENIDLVCHTIENQINDCIKPTPRFDLKINQNNTITLTVFKGENPPYTYKQKAYKRNNTSTLEVNPYEYKKLVLSSLNTSFDELESNAFDLQSKALDFTYFNKILKEQLNLDNINKDTYKTLNLISLNDKYTNAGILFSDNNIFNGIDITIYKFDNNINLIKERINLSNKSLLEQFFSTYEIFEKNYTYQTIDNTSYKRETKNSIPSIAFREALANAIVHRDYLIKANTKIEMFPSYISINSPVNLNENLSKELFLIGAFSVLNNPIVANIFFRLNLIEMFATGIKRINNSYINSYSSPEFNIQDNSINIILPVITDFSSLQLSNDEKSVLSLFKNNILYTRKELEEKTNFSKDKTIRILNLLIKKKLIKTKGNSYQVHYYKTN